MANELMNTFDSGTDIVTRASFNARIEQANTNFVNGLDGKAPLASPTFTGTVGGITKEMVGLGNVTNESKETMFSNPAFTGTPTAPTASATTNTTQVATTAFVNSFYGNKIKTNSVDFTAGNLPVGSIGFVYTV